MGAGIPFQQYGKTYDNTIVTYDNYSLRDLNLRPSKITHIRVFVKGHIVGFECFYDGISAGKRTGAEFPNSAEARDIVLEPSEYLIKITGTSQEVIDTITFYTSYGRVYTVGEYRQGLPYTLHQKGRIIKYFVVGFGRFMHNIGAYFGRQNLSRNRGIANVYQTYQPIHRSQTVSHIPQTHNQLPRSNPYTEEHKRNMIRTGPELMSQPLQRSVTQRQPLGAPKLNTALNYSTLSDESEDIGYSGLASESGKMHNSFAQSNQPKTQVFEESKYSDHSSQRPAESSSSPSKSVFFDDYQKLLKGHKKAIMTELRVVHDGHSVFGVQGIYRADGQIFVSEPHCSMPLPSNAVNESIPLSQQERIICIETKLLGTVVKVLKVFTSSGKVYYFGNKFPQKEGLQNFTVKVPRSKTCIAVTGYYSSHLQSLACYYI